MVVLMVLGCGSTVFCAIPVPRSRPIIMVHPPRSITQQYVQDFYSRTRELFCPSCFRFPAPLFIRFTSSHQPGGVTFLPEWGGGGAFGSDSIVVVTDRNSVLGPDLSIVTAHEIVHVVLYECSPAVALPRWFHEGCAEMLSGELSLAAQTVLARACVLGRAPRLSDIERVNSFNSDAAAAAYAFSREAVAFLVDTYGREVLSELLSECRTGKDFNEAVVAVLGLNMTELESLVRAHVVRRYGVWFWFVDLYVVWLGIFFLAVAAFVVTMLRKKVRRQKMTEQEEEEDRLQRL